MSHHFAVRVRHPSGRERLVPNGGMIEKGEVILETVSKINNTRNVMTPDQWRHGMRVKVRRGFYEGIHGTLVGKLPGGRFRFIVRLDGAGCEPFNADELELDETD